MHPQVTHSLGNIQRQRQFVLVGGSSVVVALLLFIKPIYDTSNIDLLLEIGGALAITCGLGVRLWCTLYIGGRKNRELLSDGPYSLCRNPLYVGSMLAAFGIGLQTEMLTLAFACGLICWAVFRTVVKREELYLLAEFGEPYRLYLQSTPRFWPRFSAYKDNLKEHSFRPPMLWNTFRDGLVLFAAIPITEAIEVAHHSGLLEAIFVLY